MSIKTQIALILSISLIITIASNTINAKVKDNNTTDASKSNKEKGTGPGV